MYGNSTKTKRKNQPIRDKRFQCKGSPRTPRRQSKESEHSQKAVEGADQSEISSSDVNAVQAFPGVGLVISRAD